jgi:hypothetical protein
MSEEKKTQKVDLSKDEDRARLKAALKKAEEVYGEQQSQEPKTEDPIEKLAEENEDLKMKLGIIAEHELEKKMNKLGIPESEREDFRKDPSMLRGFEKALESQGIARTRQTPSGSAPLNDAQMHGSQGSEQGYASVQDMIEDLYAKEKQGDKEAKKTLDKLFFKMARGTKEGKLSLQYPPASPEDLEKEKGTVDVVISPLTQEDEDASELSKLGIRKDSRRRKTRKKE